MNNLILDENINKFIREDHYKHHYSIFTPNILTTCTTSGEFSNIKFFENEIGNNITYDDHVFHIKSNYFEITNPLWAGDKKQKNSNKGRKQKEKKKNKRKIQGDGSCFNSQVSVYVSATALTETNRKPNFHKFKLFRNGKEQLPGANKKNLRDIILSNKYLHDWIKKYIHVFGIWNNSAWKPIELLNIYSVMKNYRFALLIKDNQIIKLDRVKEILDNHKVSGNSPHILWINHNKSESKLGIKFNLNENQNKKTRINIFMRGKINILGSKNDSETQELCEFLYKIIINNYDVVVVNCGFPRIRYAENVYHDLCESL